MQFEFARVFFVDNFCDETRRLMCAPLCREGLAALCVCVRRPAVSLPVWHGQRAVLPPLCHHEEAQSQAHCGFVKHFRHHSPVRPRVLSTHLCPDTPLFSAFLFYCPPPLVRSSVCSLALPLRAKPLYPSRKLSRSPSSSSSLRLCSPSCVPVVAPCSLRSHLPLPCVAESARTAGATLMRSLLLRCGPPASRCSWACAWRPPSSSPSASSPSPAYSLQTSS